MIFLTRGMSVERSATPCEKNFCMGVMLIMDKELNEKEIYKRKIIEMVESVESPAMLESIYSFIMGILSMKEKQGAD